MISVIIVVVVVVIVVAVILAVPEERNGSSRRWHKDLYQFAKMPPQCCHSKFAFCAHAPANKRMNRKSHTHQNVISLRLPKSFCTFLTFRAIRFNADNFAIIRLLFTLLPSSYCFLFSASSMFSNIRCNYPSKLFAN